MIWGLHKKPRSLTWGLSLGCLQPLWSRTECSYLPSFFSSGIHILLAPHSNPWNHIELPPVFIHEDHLNVSRPSPFLPTHTMLVSPLISLGSLGQPPSPSPCLQDPDPGLSPIALAPFRALSPEWVVRSLAFLPFMPSSTLLVFFPKAKVLPCYIFLKIPSVAFHVLQSKNQTLWFPGAPLSSHAVLLTPPPAHLVCSHSPYCAASAISVQTSSSPFLFLLPSWACSVCIICFEVYKALLQ